VSNLYANISPNLNSSLKNNTYTNFTRYILPNHGADIKLSNSSLVTYNAVKAFKLDYATSNIELSKINEKYAIKDY
jgi:hypothetical protein